MLCDESRTLLLQIARQSIADAAAGNLLIPLDLPDLPTELQALGACFVTLTVKGNLRGCIGSLEARQPLALDVQEHAVDAALNDFRFSPLRPREVPDVRIEISVLSAPAPLTYSLPEELPSRLRPGEDGVILINGLRRATFLPQVWDQIPEPAMFLGMLCEKMGADAGLWRKKKLDVLTYQVEHFEESE
jgi:uncharacterized protein